MATVYGIVKQSGGHIWVYSEEGKGSTFKVYLPIDDDLQPEAQTVRRGEAERGTATVLIVEDEEQVRQLASMVLSEHGYRVYEAPNGEAALGTEFELPSVIDLLVTDVIMPKMGGPELARKLTARNPEMRVLFVSGYTENAAVHQGMPNSCFHYLAKPFTPDDLARKVGEVLQLQTVKA